MSAILLESQMVHYEVLGRGRPLIFLHGWVGSWRYWIPVMQAASISFRTYAIDLWGFGDTARFPGHYGLDSQVALVERFLQQMGMGRVALVGHGLGAMVAVMFALRHPEIADRVMAVSFPVDESKIHPRLRTSSPADLAEWLLARSPLAEAVRAETPKTDPQAISASLNGSSMPAVREAIKQLQRACLLVNGVNDPAVGVPDLDVVLHLPEPTHGILFDSSGHFPMLDESSLFNRLLLDFLALDPGESPRQLQLKEEWKRRVR
jgi:pimeloyl-ACP methyl ester carboxylesterase